MQQRVQQVVHDLAVRKEGARRNNVIKAEKRQDRWGRINQMYANYGAMLQGHAVGGVRGGGTVVLRNPLPGAAPPPP